MLGAPQIDLEDGKDSLVLRCEADANPPASIIWKRAGRSEIASLQVSLLASFHSFSLCVVRLNFKCFCYSGFSESLFWIGFQWISILSRRDDCSVWCSHAENLLETPPSMQIQFNCKCIHQHLLSFFFCSDLFVLCCISSLKWIAFFFRMIFMWTRYQSSHALSKYFTRPNYLKSTKQQNTQRQKR